MDKRFTVLVPVLSDDEVVHQFPCAMAEMIPGLFMQPCPYCMPGSCSDVARPAAEDVAQGEPKPATGLTTLRINADVNDPRLKELITRVQQLGLSVAGVDRELCSADNLSAKRPKKKVGRKPVPPEVKNKVLQLCKAGMSDRAIGKKLDLGKTTLWSIRRKHIPEASAASQGPCDPREGKS